ncbi:MAG: Nif3-like dinuclear metal center hexameric protein, partial [Lactobacillus iners]|nr:Nif3-like dinuclear metal center hexameric protein [Lactobacillus iners]
YTEELFKYKIAEQLKTWLANADSSISIMVSKTNTNPFQDLF